MHAVALAALSVLAADIPAPPDRKPIETQIPDALQQAASAPAGGHGVSEVVVSLYVFGIALLVIMAILLAGVVWVALRAGKGWEEPNTFRILVAVFAVGMGAFLVVAGYSSTQMGSFFGLLGAIVGYVFGSTSRDRTTPPPPS